MQVIVHSDSQRARDCFKRIRRGGEFEVEVYPSRDFRKNLRERREPFVLYLDIQSFSPAEITRALKSLSTATGVLAGVIDPKESIRDVAGLFHQGLFDYVGKTMWREGITLKRFRTAVEAFSEELDSDDSEHIDGARLLPTESWSQITPGNEYTFCFMFFELDLNQDWKSKAGREHLERVTASLESHVQRTVSAINGRIWMWAEYGGLVLFPFDGRSCDAILTCYRMVLNRTIISAEDFEFDTLLSYRIALHIGNTVFRPRGQTGTIISDSVNFIFHLGHQFAEPGGFYLTQAVYPYLPKGIEESFLDCGDFEGNRIFRMKRPI